MAKITDYTDGGAALNTDYFIVARSPYGAGDNFKIAFQNITLAQSQVTNLTTDLAARLVATNNLSDISSASTARTNLGLGTMATQSASNYLALAGGTMSGNLFLNADASSAMQPVTYQQFNVAIAGFTPKQNCFLATTTALTGTYNNGAGGVGATFTFTATGAQTIDAVTTQLGYRILMKNQSDATQNGIYTVTTKGATGVQEVWTRASDFDNSPVGEIYNGVYTIISDAASSQGGTMWYVSTIGTVTVGTTAITFSQANYFSAGNGISIVGNTISANINSTNLQITGSAINTIQNIATTSSPQFSALSLGGSSSVGKLNIPIASGAAVSAGVTLSGTMNGGDSGTSGDQYGFQMSYTANPNFTPTTGIFGYACSNIIGINVASRTIPYTACFVANPGYSNVSTSPVTRAINFWSRAGTQYGATITVTHSFGGLFENPFAGNSSTKALYAENLVVGSSYLDISPPSNGMICVGKAGFGTSNPLTLHHINSGTISGFTSTCTASSLVSYYGGDTVSSVGYEIYLDNVTASLDVQSYVRNTLTAGAAYAGMDIGTNSNHPIRFLTNGTSSPKVLIPAAGGIQVIGSLGTVDINSAGYVLTMGYSGGTNYFRAGLDLIIQTNAGSSPVSAITVSQTGGVGITSTLTMGNTTTTQGTVRFYPGNNSAWWDVLNNAGSLNINQVAAGTRLAIDGNGNVTVTNNLTANNLLSSTYTPTITNSSNVNVASSVPSTVIYSRCGDLVTMTGSANIVTSASGTAFSFYYSVPISSAFNNIWNAAGVAEAFQGSTVTNRSSVSIIAENGGSRIQFLINGFSSSLPLGDTIKITFSLQYRVI